MFKKILIKTLLKFDRLLLAEKARLRRKSFEAIAMVDGTVRLFPECSIFNYQNDRSKIQVGSHTCLRGELLLFAHGGAIRVGEYCYIGAGTRIWSSASVTIGDRVLIAHNVNIHDNISHPLDEVQRHEQYKDIISKGHPKHDLDLNEAPVVIGDDAWIGFNASILKGVTLGQGAVVGASAVVTEDVPPWSVVVGNPAKVIRTLK